jgi:sialic acid synthase SpsE
MQKININGKNIGDDYPCYTIAEAGANHEGEVGKAFQLIDAAKESGVDAIKFQNYTASKLTTRTAPKYWDDGIKNESQFDVFNKLDKLHDDEWRQIFEHANKKNITCFSTPFDLESVDLLESFNVPAYKIASADITHIPLVKKIASKKKPVFMSTGMASIEEIHDAVSAIQDQGNEEMVIMHCITSYPTRSEDANLEMIRSLNLEFPDCVIGYSDHTLGIDVAVFSTFYGSKCIEKHFTHDKNLSISRDHRLSLDSNDFKELIERLKLCEISCGSGTREHFSAEDDAVKYARRSIVSVKKILKGTKITKNLLEIKRPGTGIKPKFLDEIIGKITSKDIDEDVPITWNDLE